jgi:hypothetical protein
LHWKYWTVTASAFRVFGSYSLSASVLGEHWILA